MQSLIYVCASSKAFQKENADQCAALFGNASVTSGILRLTEAAVGLLGSCVLRHTDNKEPIFRFQVAMEFESLPIDPCVIAAERHVCVGDAGCLDKLHFLVLRTQIPCLFLCHLPLPWVVLDHVKFISHKHDAYVLLSLG